MTRDRIVTKKSKSSQAMQEQDPASSYNISLLYWTTTWYNEINNKRLEWADILWKYANI